MSSLQNWRRHARYGRRGGYPVRYGRDLGVLSTTKGKIGLALAAVGVGAAAFFISKRSAASQSPASPAPAVPATPNPANPTPAPAAPPVPTSASLGKVTTHDPPPAGDLNLFDQPNGNRIGGAEKDSIVNIISNDGTWAQISTNNTGGRYVDQSGFVHAQFLADPSQAVAQGILSTAGNLGQSVANAFGF